MALRAAALALALGLFAATDVWAQRVGSWRNQPGTNSIVYDGRGRRLFWDDNGQLVGRYDFRTNRYETIDARPGGIGTSLANVPPVDNGPFLTAGKISASRLPQTARRPFPAPLFVGGKRK